MKLRAVVLRSVGHSSQKLWPEIDFWKFPQLYPLEHEISKALYCLWVYNICGLLIAISITYPETGIEL